MNIYSLMDLKLREYGPPLVANNDEAMKRAIRDGIPGSRTTMEKYPSDFNLMLLGSMDMDTGLIVPEEVPTLVENLGVLLPEVPSAANG